MKFYHGFLLVLLLSACRIVEVPSSGIEEGGSEPLGSGGAGGAPEECQAWTEANVELWAEEQGGTFCGTWQGECGERLRSPIPCQQGCGGKLYLPGEKLSGPIIDGADILHAEIAPDNVCQEQYFSLVAEVSCHMKEAEGNVLVLCADHSIDEAANDPESVCDKITMGGLNPDFSIFCCHGSY